MLHLLHSTVLWFLFCFEVSLNCVRYCWCVFKWRWSLLLILLASVHFSIWLQFFTLTQNTFCIYHKIVVLAHYMVIWIETFTCERNREGITRNIFRGCLICLRFITFANPVEREMHLRSSRSDLHFIWTMIESYIDLFFSENRERKRLIGWLWDL